MLALLDAVPIEKRGTKEKLYRIVRRANKIKKEHGVVLGADVMYITTEIEQDIKPNALKKRLEALSREMRASGADSVCCSRRFDYGEYFTKDGFTPPDLTNLYELTAHQAVEKLPGIGETVFMAAPRLNELSERTLTALCKRYRYVLTDIKSGTEAAFLGIQRRMGISIIERPAPERILNASAAMFLGERQHETELSPDCIVYAVSKNALKGVKYNTLVTGIDVELPPEYESDLPQGYAGEPLIANALRNMTLPTGMPSLRSLSVKSGFRLDKDENV